MGKRMTTDQWFQIDQYTSRARHIAGVDVRFGTGRIREITDYLTENGRSRVMLVTGRSGSRNVALMDPLRDALGALLVGEFTEASPGKSIDSVYQGIARMDEVEADCLLGIGGGSSLDTARQISAFGGDGRPQSFFVDAVERGRIPRVNAGSNVDVILVPTTLAGADLSTGGSIQVVPATSDRQGVRMNPRHVAPRAVFYDPRLYDTSPRSALVGSALNALNKGIETVYSPLADPYSDAVSTHGVELMVEGLLALGDDKRTGLQAAVAGAILVQLDPKISILHAFGQAVARNSRIQQGIAHAVLTPHVLGFMKGLVPLRGESFARAFSSLAKRGAVEAGDPDSALIEGVIAVRDALNLPSSLGEIEGSEELHLAVCAESARESPLMDGSPLDRPLTMVEAQSILQAAF